MSAYEYLPSILQLLFSRRRCELDLSHGQKPLVFRILAFGCAMALYVKWSPDTIKQLYWYQANGLAGYPTKPWILYNSQG